MLWWSMLYFLGLIAIGYVVAVHKEKKEIKTRTRDHDIRVQAMNDFKANFGFGQGRADIEWLAANWKLATTKEPVSSLTYFTAIGCKMPEPKSQTRTTLSWDERKTIETIFLTPPAILMKAR